ncbi:MAG: GumC family protein [Planctomycetota bacterium]|jgi:capsular exopolysaccharide synthesis family protein
MDMIKKHREQQLAQDYTCLEAPVASGADSSNNLIMPILRRWYIVLITSLLMCAIGIPIIWLSIEPLHSVTGAIRVAPILSNILTGEADRGEISNYQSFINTQAEMATSNRVVQRVADYLAGKNLSLFSGEAIRRVTSSKQAIKDTKTKTEPASILKHAISHGTIKAASDRHTELIKITMNSTKPVEAKQIVDAFIKAYMAVEVTASTQNQDQKLSVLENERRVLQQKMQSQHEAIRRLAQEYGTVSLGGRQDMMLQRVTTLLAELTKVEARRINLEAQVQILEHTNEKGIPPAELLKMHNEHVNSDSKVQELTRTIVQLEQDLIVAKQIFAPNNPALKQKQELLDAFQSRLEEQRREVGENFHDIVSETTNKAHKEKLFGTQAELEQSKAYEKRLRDVLAEEDNQTIELGRKQLQIQDFQFQLELDREMYDRVLRRIQELDMERKRPARISVAYNADIVSIQDKRFKYTIALVFGAMACGMMLAFFKGKSDLSLRTPDDVVKRIGIRIIGTTTNIDYLNKFKLPQQVINDYQTIRANLGLLNGGGIPNKLVITSAGTRDGKTTFSINLATSLAKAGKKILLIDGDLRKPDIRWLLNLPKGSRGLQDVILGKNFENVVDSMPLRGFDVLTADSRNASDAFELLSLPHLSKCLNIISAKYDHVIIDTPPVLAFPDALLWAKIADGVILTSFAGQTEEQDLRETLERLAEINVKVLGTILSSVRTNYSYNRYGYSYYANRSVDKSSRRKNNKTALLLPAKKHNKTPNDSKT